MKVRHRKRQLIAMYRPVQGASGGNNSAIREFLRFLERDIDGHPERLQLIDPELIGSLRAFTRIVSVDLSQPLNPEDD